MDNGISLVFVYGTLLSGECNHRPYLAASKRVGGPARLAAQLWDTGHSYPAVVMDASIRDAARFVRGELYRVTRQTLTRLDELEDYYGPGAINEYERIEAEVEVEVEGEATGARHRAWVYVYVSPPPQGQRIDSGDWRSYRSEGYN
ncbi:putative gamma-glutamylcyclotransferase [Paenibacillus sp. 598K]|uniref:gamma-glutamylcyclotransferase family protein n=1 Tax=Paenibacillus sp. 598K TaxID=1117987 RepID=UPI000FF920FF|nr:gamma-glutamylcyclotransferase [Paenibacillus sp. 598K]GBF77580.1 putative gamma-glutamylcyclotransferase [Paenibacillus sp. 598K]